MRAPQAAANESPRWLGLAQGGGRERTTCARALSLLHRCRLLLLPLLVLLVCSFRADLVPLLVKRQLRRLRRSPWRTKRPKGELGAGPRTPRLAAGVTARAGVRPEPATRLPAPSRAPHGAAAAQAPALRAVFLLPSSSARAGGGPAALPAPAALECAPGASWAGRIADTRGPTGRERGFSGPVGRARVTRALGRAMSPPSADPAPGRVLPPLRWRGVPSARASPLGGGGRRHLEPCPGRTGRLRARGANQ